VAQTPTGRPPVLATERGQVADEVRHLRGREAAQVRVLREEALRQRASGFAGPGSVRDELDLEALPALEIGRVVLWPTGKRVSVGEHQGPATLVAPLHHRVDLRA